MAGDDGAADAKNSTRTFRWWFDAARYALALVVTVLIVTVIAEAIRVVLRPEELLIRVQGGAVTVERNTTATAKQLTFAFAVTFTNPSGRARIYYTDISMYFFGRPGAGAASSSNAAEYFLVYDDIKDVDATPQSTVFNFARGVGNVEPAPFFDVLYNNDSGITDAMLTVNGTVTVGLYGHNRSQGTTLYYCKPVTLAADTSEVSPSDTVCTKDPPAEGATIA